MDRVVQRAVGAVWLALDGSPVAAKSGGKLSTVCVWVSGEGDSSEISDMRESEEEG